MTKKTIDVPAEAVQIQTAIVTDSPATEVEAEAETVAAANITATAVPVVARNNADDSSSPKRTETEVVCAWIGFILINAAFLYLAIWTSFIFPNWGAGFGVAVAYATGLLVTGYCLRRRNGGKDSVLTSLLFLLAIMAILVGGLYLPLNVFPCNNTFANWNNYYDDDSDWVTETKNLPSNVESMWRQDYDSDVSKFFGRGDATFIHLDTAGVTLFKGTQDGRYDEKLYKLEDGNAPEIMTNFPEPRNFVLLENETACFIFDNNPDDYRERKLACTTDGSNYTTSAETFSSPSDLLYSSGLLWFRADPQVGGYEYVLYSIDPGTLSEVTLHSSPADETESTLTPIPTDSECSDQRTYRVRFLGFLFLSALPSLIAALAIDYVYQTPSMPIAVYGSATWLVVCLIIAIDPFFYDLYEFLRWWFVFTAGPWLVLLTLGNLTNRITRVRLIWASSYAAVVYTVGMFMLFNVFSEFFWRWAVMTVLVVPPLFFMSLVTRQLFVMIVTGIVLMIDAWRLADYFAYDGGLAYSSYILTQVGVLGASGILLAVIGYLVSKRQARIESAVSKWTKSNLTRWVIQSEDGDGTDAASEDVEGGSTNEVAGEAA